MIFVPIVLIVATVSIALHKLITWTQEKIKAVEDDDLDLPEDSLDAGDFELEETSWGGDKCHRRRTFSLRQSQKTDFRTNKHFRKKRVKIL